MALVDSLGNDIEDVSHVRHAYLHGLLGHQEDELLDGEEEEESDEYEDIEVRTLFGEPPIPFIPPPRCRNCAQEGEHRG